MIQLVFLMSVVLIFSEIKKTDKARQREAIGLANENIAEAKGEAEAIAIINQALA